MADYGGSSSASSTCYSTFGSIHVHKFLFGVSIFGLLFFFPLLPIAYIYSHGFSIEIFLHFKYFLALISFILILLGNRCQIPHLYIPPLVFMVLGLGYATFIIYNAYFQIITDLLVFKTTIKHAIKPSFTQEAAITAAGYFDGSFTIHTTFFSILTLVYLINLILTDLFFMLEQQGKSLLPWF